jgi:ABC-type Fe3+ transport system substrate-binding protein
MRGIRLALGVVALVAASPAWALTQDEISNLKGPDRQKVLEEGARKEGVVSLYTGMLVDEFAVPTKNAFEKKYPYIKFEFQRIDTASLIQRLLAEKRANAVHVDVISGNIASAYKKAGVLQSFTSPLMAEYPPEYLDADHTYMVIRTTYQGLAWNTKTVADKDVPKTWDDLLDTKWKGKMVWSQDLASGAPLFIAHIIKAMGEDKAKAYLDKLAKQGVQTFSGSNRTVLDHVIAGDAALGINMDFSQVSVSQEKGAPVAGGSPDPVLTKPGTIEVVKGAPHPYAAMLLADFLLSKDDGQTILRQSNYNPAHPGLEVAPAVRWAQPRLNGKKELILTPEEVDVLVVRGGELYNSLFR